MTISNLIRDPEVRVALGNLKEAFTRFDKHLKKLEAIARSRTLGTVPSFDPAPSNGEPLA